MKAFNGFESKPQTSRPRQLPAGPYVARIKAARIEGDEPDQSLVIKLDVCEGEFENYFFNRYKQDQKNYESGKSNFEPKYKGIYRIRVPNDENTKAQYPESDRKRFGDMIYRIEESNPGYHWDWDEKGLAGLIVGINMQEDEYNGNKFTKIGRLEIASGVRDGSVQAMRPRERRGDADDSRFVQQPTIDPKSGFTAVETDELPF